MRRSLIALVPLLALACDREPAAPDVRESIVAPNFSATSSWEEQVYQMKLPWFAPCLEEEFLWTGSVTIRYHFVTRPNGSVHVNGNVNYDDSRFIGAKSGLWVPVAGTYNHFDGDFPCCEGSWTLNMRITLENQETGAVMDVPAKVQLVATGDGSQKVVLDLEFLSTCTLR
jgi:hypothetical protein